MSQSNAARRQLEAERRQRAKAAAQEQDRAGRRHRLLVRGALAGGLAAAVAGVTALGVLTGGGDGGATAGTASTRSSGTGALPGSGTALPPWPAPANAAALTKAVGLTPAPDEGVAEHYHAHLEVRVNGKAVPVAAGIGVDEAARLMSPLHTHDLTGEVHVESPDVGRRFTLGQLFGEWDVALSEHQLGGLHADATHALTLSVNGKKVAGDPADLVLAEGQHIELTYGAA